jgi:hypothetical protein
MRFWIRLRKTSRFRYGMVLVLVLTSNVYFYTHTIRKVTFWKGASFEQVSSNHMVLHWPIIRSYRKKLCSYFIVN